VVGYDDGVYSKSGMMRSDVCRREGDGLEGVG